jgi:hypothetical protein
MRSIGAARNFKLADSFVHRSKRPSQRAKHRADEERMECIPWSYAGILPGPHGAQAVLCLGENRSPRFKLGGVAQLRLCGCARSSDRSSLLKALPAIHGTPLRRLEGDRGLFTALRADRLRFHPLRISRIPVVPLRAICLARLAPLRLVLETLVGEEHLLAGGEDEFRSAIDALQHLVMVFHTLLRGRVRTGEAAVQPAPDGPVNARSLLRFSPGRWHEAAGKNSSDVVV